MINRVLQKGVNIYRIIKNRNVLKLSLKSMVKNDFLLNNTGRVLELINKEIIFDFDRSISDQILAQIKCNDTIVCVNVTNQIDLYMLDEKFILQDYHYFTLNGLVKTVVFDIGMNNGYASLYFASRPEVDKIYSFELFKPTYDIAMRNFELNKELSKKIKAFPFGLSNQREEKECLYSKSHPTACGFSDVKLFDSKLTDVIPIVCEVKKASEILNEIYVEEISGRGGNIVLKIDVEGAEYHIIDDLDSIKFLKYVDIIMMEYHMGQEHLIEKFSQYGFAGFSFHHGSFGDGNVRGMLYCVKNKC